jgi:hypothetical protein
MLLAAFDTKCLAATVPRLDAIPRALEKRVNGDTAFVAWIN